MKLNYLLYIIAAIAVFAFITLIAVSCGADEIWKVTAYCSKSCCCGQWADGHFASGKEVYDGGVAINWLKFGTNIQIDGKNYTVEDRGAKTYFGSKDNKIKAVDIYYASHEEALKHGVKYKEVTIL